MRIEQIEDLLDEFDFGKVKKVMDCLEWKYHGSADGEISVGELRRMARYLLQEVYDFDDSPYECISSGGFQAVRQVFAEDSKKYLTLQFVVTEWSNPVC
jgi:hypothetical protein